MASNKGTRKPPGKGTRARNVGTAIMPAVKQGAATVTGAGVSTLAAEVADGAMKPAAATETVKRSLILSVIGAVAGVGAAFVASKIKATRKFVGAILGGTALATGARATPAIKELGGMIADKLKKDAPATETPEGSKGISRTKANDRPVNGRVRDLVN